MRDPKMLSYSNIYLQENYSNIQEKQAEIYDVLRCYKEGKPYFRVPKYETLAEEDKEMLYGMREDLGVEQENVMREDEERSQKKIDVKLKGKGENSEESDVDKVLRDVQREFLKDYSESKSFIKNLDFKTIFFQFTDLRKPSGYNISGLPS
ncbi:uncharacterized protein [Rhodnius prolixus]|uniref:uncharacterized protein n=1 Tax=Rhodnius prolixus TaxID=13249 RepID=UPI003D188450